MGEDIDGGTFSPARPLYPPRGGGSAMTRLGPLDGAGETGWTRDGGRWTVTTRAAAMAAKINVVETVATW